MEHTTNLLLAFGFGTPVMLGWLAAAAVPLLIHLYNRRKHREAPWAAVQFLLAAVRKNARRMQFEQWLLVAVRMLIIMFVVLAVAEPYTQRLGVLFAPHTPTHKLFIIDGSYSMAYRQQDDSLFDRARRMIAQIVDEGRSGDGYSLVLMGEPSRAIIRTPSRLPVDFLNELDGLKQPLAGANLFDALTLAGDIMDRAERGSQPFTQHEIYIFSDMGATTWAPEESRARRSEQNRRLGALAKRGAVVVLDLGHDEPSNTAVTHLTQVEPFAATRRPVTFQATIRNFGQAQPQKLVELLIDGVVVADRTINLQADGEQTETFTHAMQTPGSHTASVRIARDFLPIDDTRHFALRMRDHLQVLLVAGKRGAADFLQLALQPNPSQDGPTQTRVVNDAALSELDLHQFDCIMLANVAQLTSSEARLLQAYLKQGGGLVVFLGDQVMPEVYDAALVMPGSDGNLTTSLLGATLGDIVHTAAQFVPPNDYDHPIVRPFKDRPKSAAGLLSTPVYSYYRLNVDKKRHDVKIPLALTDGHPAIVAATYGQGRTVLVATAASTASVDTSTQLPWTLWPAWPSFLPIVREMANFAVAGAAGQFNVQVGQPFGQASDVRAVPLIQIERPDKRSDTVRVNTVDGRRQWSYSATDQTGVYEARPVQSDVSAVQFAVNVDPKESELQSIDTRSLPQEISVSESIQNTNSQDVNDLIGEHRFHRWLLTAALALVLVELLLAWQFGRGAA